MIVALLFACHPPLSVDSSSHDGTGGGPGTDTGELADTPVTDDTADTGKPELAHWQFLIYMDGDNDLEAYVVHDLNELELTGSGDGVEVLVQADRIEGYSKKDGDWTGARRYRIEHDEDPDLVASPVIEDLGEIDMGSPDTLAAFLDWAATDYPAERRVLVLWNHGDGWLVQDPEAAPAGAPPPGIASDDTSGSAISIAEGELAAGLEASVAAHGRLDVVAFDACNMASWEVAHALQPYAAYLSAAESWVGWEGFIYQDVLAYMRANPEAGAGDVATEMSRGAVEQGGELTHSATDLDAVLAVSAAISELGAIGLADPEASVALLAARDRAHGVEEGYEAWYLDLGDFAVQVEAGAHPELSPVAATLRTSLDTAVLGSFTADDYSWAQGLTLLFDPIPRYMDSYSTGDGATWSRDTNWDEYLLSLE